MSIAPKDKNCVHCGTRLPKRVVFKCPKCGQYNVPSGAPVKNENGKIDDGTILLHEVADYDVVRLRTGPWDINFGDPIGIPEDSVTLIGGEPGAGKSTLALQLSDAMALASKKEVLYLCAEEGKKQVKSRYTRLGGRSRRVRIVPLERMQDANLEVILINHSLCGVVLDSIAAFTTDPVEAVNIVSHFKSLADQFRVPFIVINHVTKGGEMAGMMKLQHAGDISLMLTKGEKDVVERAKFKVLSFESEEIDEDENEDDETDDDESEEEEVELSDYFEITEPRELYTEKSRYGPSGLSTFYAMTERGLIEIEFEPEIDGI
jgi:predicted ATP-dependent serine protease